MKLFIKFNIALLLVVFLVASIFGWGFRSHRNIHAAAIDGLPDGLRKYFEAHREFIIRESVTPDIRRNDDPTEGPNHYVNLDRFGEYPFEEFPLLYDDAFARYGEETLRSYGLILWRIDDWFDGLKVAMKNKDEEKILRFAADIGHYLADLHMPLHTTSHYDGQLTNQRGIHRRFETDLPARYDHQYSWEVPEAAYVEKPLEKAFYIALESFRLVDRVYEADLIAREGIPENELYRIEERGGRRVYIYNELYYQQFHDTLDGMVESRLQLAVQRIRDFWYSAWIKAGRPDLYNY